MPRQSESEVSAIARAALDYRAAGWSVVALRPRDKRPLIGWERFQHELHHPPLSPSGIGDGPTPMSAS